jgi:hypothetical protein
LVLRMPTFVCISMAYRVIGKSRDPFLTYVLFVKNKSYWNQKTKNSAIVSVPDFRRVVCHCLQGTISLPRASEGVHHTRYCRIVWHSRTGKCNAELIVGSWARARRQAAFGSGQPLYCQKDVLLLAPFADSWLTGSSRLQHDVTCVGCCTYSHSDDMVCLVRQSNCSELQLSIGTLIWDAWRFDNPVHIYKNRNNGWKSIIIEIMALWPSRYITEIT